MSIRRMASLTVGARLRMVLADPDWFFPPFAASRLRWAIGEDG